MHRAARFEQIDESAAAEDDEDFLRLVALPGYFATGAMREAREVAAAERAHLVEFQRDRVRAELGAG